MVQIGGKGKMKGRKEGKGAVFGQKGKFKRSPKHVEKKCSFAYAQIFVYMHLQLTAPFTPQRTLFSVEYINCSKYQLTRADPMT
jgi:hypothetical protein